MKIVNIVPQYSDGWGYQENYLTKYQKRLGYDVTVIGANYSFNDKKVIAKNEKTDYYTQDGVKVIRIPIKDNRDYDYKFRDYDTLEQSLIDEKPDILFIHSVQFVYIKTITKFLREHKEVKAFVDNHADFSNSATNWVSKNVLHKIIWRHYAQMIDPYIIKWFGVLPARVDFLIDMYGLPKEKVELLVMGADDDCVEKYRTQNYKEEYRKRYGISESDFLLVTGGKIDQAKRQTLLLMDAVNESANKDLKLIVFGSVVPELKDEVQNRCSQRVQYIGWADGDASYPLFNMADIVVFPGRHSVYWEQVAGMGIPMICKLWAGTTHVDNGGNVIFLRNDCISEIKKAVDEALVRLDEMHVIAENNKRKFLYSEIAKKSIQV